jgi:hypothetical protein
MVWVNNQGLFWQPVIAVLWYPFIVYQIHHLKHRARPAKRFAIDKFLDWTRQVSRELTQKVWVTLSKMQEGVLLKLMGGECLAVRLLDFLIIANVHCKLQHRRLEQCCHWVDLLAIDEETLALGE